MFIQGVKVTKTYKIAGFNIASKWKRKLHGCSPKEGWIILTSLDNLTEAIRTYKKRFKRCDPGRFPDLGNAHQEKKKCLDILKVVDITREDTNLYGERLISLILLVAIAYSLATFQGQKIKSQGVQKYVGRVKDSGRMERRDSSFYIGLYGLALGDFYGIVLGFG